MIESPGSVSVTSLGQGLHSLLVCNNYIHTITSHILDENQGFKSISHETLLRAELDVPDGISVNALATWLAVSNHETNEVFLYENNRDLNEESPPDGRLLGVGVPHGLRFSSDGKHVLVADAGSQNVMVYASQSGDWTGDTDPCNSLQVVDDKNFERGHVSNLEGGAKGLELCSTKPLMFITCEYTPLAVFNTESLGLSLRKTTDQGKAVSTGSIEPEVAQIVLPRALSTTAARFQEINGSFFTQQYAYTPTPELT